jgi:hypothetical protein
MALKIKAAKAHITNNRLLFILGLAGVAASVLLHNTILWTLALVMALTGLFNANTWSQEKGWGKLNAAERKVRLIFFAAFTAVMLLAAWLFIWIDSLA